MSYVWRIASLAAVALLAPALILVAGDFVTPLALSAGRIAVADLLP